MPIFFFQFFAFLAGLVLSLQAGINGKLKTSLGSPIAAAIVSFAVGFVFLFAALLIRKESLPTIKTLGAIPPYLYIGGLLGAIYVAAATILFPKLGALQTTGLVVAGQIVASLVIDHFGFLGIAAQPITVYRLLAAGLLLGGVVLSGYQPK
jgi:transporter family-2 protein